LPGRPFFLSLSAFLFLVVKEPFFRGFFAKMGVLLWCFCGEVVVDYVVNRGALMVDFWRLKNFTFLNFILLRVEIKAGVSCH